jgi:O-antigen/teichoic acid export membrane protein
MASAVGALVLLWLLTHYLGPGGFGQFTLATSFVALFFVVTDLGAQSIAVREMAQAPPRSAAVVGQLFSLKLIMSLAAFVVSAIVAWIIPLDSFRGFDMRLGVLLAGLTLLTVPFLSTAGAVFQTSLKMIVPSVSEVVSRAVTVSLVAGLQIGLTGRLSLSQHWRLPAVLLAATIGAWAGAMLSFNRAQILVPIRPLFDRVLARSMVRDSVPLGIVLVLGIIHYKIDVFVLAAMRGNTAVGLYGVATKLLDVALAGSAIFMGLAFPVLSGRVLGDPALLQRAFQKALDFMLIVGVAGAVFTTTLAPFLVRSFAGGNFAKAAVPVAIIGWAIPVSFSNTLFAHLLVAANQQARAVPISLLAITINIGLNVALIPALGSSAPALVTVISETVGMLGIAVIAVRHFRLRPSARSIILVLLCGSCAAAPLVLLQQVNVGLAVGCGLLVYGGALLATRLLRIDEFRHLLDSAYTFQA